jgi:hypothetical protein
MSLYSEGLVMSLSLNSKVFSAGSQLQKVIKMADVDKMMVKFLEKTVNCRTTKKISCITSLTSKI